MKKYIFYLMLLLVIFSCGKSKKKTDEQKPVITVTIEPQKYFTEALAHGYFIVNSMVPHGSNPETYDPTPKQLVDLAKSRAYLRIGYIGFELLWMDRLSATAPHLEFFETSQKVDLIFEPNIIKAENHGLSTVEPHLWCSVENAKIIAENTLHILISLDRQHDKIYYARYDSLLNHISQVDTIVRRLIGKPDTDKAFAIYHPSLSYFARDYGLTQIAIEQNGKEPSPSELAKIIDNCKRMHVHVVFVQPEFDRRNAEIIAKQIGARVVTVNPLNIDWDKEMIAVAQALASNTK
jgi:zinc transport system substrate-binding protein